jgi:hypothetical protein
MNLDYPMEHIMQARPPAAVLSACVCLVCPQIAPDAAAAAAKISECRATFERAECLRPLDAAFIDFFLFFLASLSARLEDVRRERSRAADEGRGVGAAE